MWRRRVAATLAVAAVAGLAAGCGGGGSARLTKAQYEQRVQTDGKALTQVTSAISSGVTSPASLKTALANAQKAIGKAADDLGSLAPPVEAEAANAAFVKALRAIDSQLGQIGDALAKGDMTAVLADVEKLGSSREVAAAKAAAKQLKALGYKLGALGS